MSAATNDGKDSRTTRQLIRQWERLNTVKNSLIKLGLINGDATPQDVLDVLRREIPADLFD